LRKAKEKEISMIENGIILAGGTGSRMHPLTRSVSKQLLPVYDKPMVYYPLTTLMLAGIRRILVITTPHEQALFQTLLGDGSQWGLELQYKVQPDPGGLAQAFLIGKEFIAGKSCSMVLGDNIFYGHGLQGQLQSAGRQESGATVFGYYVKNPEAFGVAEFDDKGVVVGLEEKPAKPKSKYAVTGLYFYDDEVTARAEALKPSPRGELEITDLNKTYLADGKLRLEKFGRGMAWLDTGSPEALLQAGNFIQTIQARQGLQVACPEEIAFGKGWIDAGKLESMAAALSKTEYGQYLYELLKSK
jgi:glucose-1-phosphate thymidylyltransferase